MGKLIISGLLVLLAISIISVASAVVTNPDPDITTVIAGKIYDSPNFETANGVDGANVNVTCNSTLLTTVSLSDGTYSVNFKEVLGYYCPEGSIVSVVAEKNGVSNSGTGEVHDYNAIMPDLYIGVVNIALVPEFGLIVGAITLFGAIGVFFMIRRK